jgi:hypothetical protein
MSAMKPWCAFADFAEIRRKTYLPFPCDKLDSAHSLADVKIHASLIERAEVTAQGQSMPPSTTSNEAAMGSVRRSFWAD